MTARIATAVVAWSFVGLAAARGWAAERPQVALLPLQGTVTIDGDPGEAAWLAAPRHGGFVERKPGLGQLPPDATHFAVLADRAALYVAVWCADSQPDDVRARTTARDSFAIFDDDAISLKIDPTLDYRTTFGFAMNALGARLDYRGVNEAEMRLEADAIWQGAAKRQPWGWSAEFRVPWPSLGIDPAVPPATLGLNFSRDHSRRNATYDWALMPPPFAPIAASLYGELREVGQISGLAEGATATQAGSDGGNLIIAPYVLGGAHRNAAGSYSPQANAGGDLTFRLGNRARGQLTVNTDFAQVDLDDQVVNLTRFSLFFPEKRDFFAKDNDFFLFGRSQVAQAFHSRRIGLGESGPIALLGGAKVIGQVGGGKLGLIEVVTGRDQNEPLTSHSVARGQWAVGSGGSNFGLIGTTRHTLNATGSTSTLAGIDGSLRPAQSPVQIDAFAMASSAESTGLATAVDARWRGALWRPRLQYAMYSQGFRADLGFVQRTGIHDGSLALGYEPRLGQHGLEKLSCSAKAQGIWATSDSALLDRGAGAGCDLNWDAGWRLGWGGQLVRETVPAATKFVEVIAVDAGDWARHSVGIDANSPDVRAVSVSTGIGWQRFYGGVDTQVYLGSTVRAKDRLRLEAALTWHHISMPLQSYDSYVANGRAAIGISPDLNLDIFAGWNHLQHTLRNQARLRWTWARGSDAFLVWQEDHNTTDGATVVRSIVAKVVWAWL